MERTRTPHRWWTLFAILALVFALAACGSAVVPGELEDDQAPIEDVVDDGAPDGEQPGGPSTPDEVENTYDEPPMIDGEPVTEEDIQDRDLDGAILTGDFSGFDFSGMDLANAILAGAKFDGANFTGAKFNGVKAWHGSFVGANFTDARLAGADLSYGIFDGAIFTRAQMPGNSFKMVGASFTGATWVDGETVCANPSVGGCN